MKSTPRKKERKPANTSKAPTNKNFQMQTSSDDITKESDDNKKKLVKEGREVSLNSHSQSFFLYIPLIHSISSWNVRKRRKDTTIAIKKDRIKRKWVHVLKRNGQYQYI